MVEALANIANCTLAYFIHNTQAPSWWESTEILAAGIGILGTAIGGITTYFSTQHLQKRNAKLRLQSIAMSMNSWAKTTYDELNRALPPMEKQLEKIDELIIIIQEIFLSQKLQSANLVASSKYDPESLDDLRNFLDELQKGFTSLSISQIEWTSALLNEEVYVNTEMLNIAYEIESRVRFNEQIEPRYVDASFESAQLLWKAGLDCQNIRELAYWDRDNNTDLTSALQKRRGYLSILLSTQKMFKEYLASVPRTITPET